MVRSFSINTLTSPRGKHLEYLLSLPEEFKTNRAYPALLAIPPGEQTMELAQVYEPWMPYFQKQGWVVCFPTTPDGKLFFQGSERYLTLFMDHVESRVNVAGGKFYLFGVSNGGISAFRVATLNPDRFHSLTVLPGWPKPADVKRLANILALPVNFLVGETDSRWRKKSEKFSTMILSMGGDAMLEIIPGEGHMAFQVYPPERLMQVVVRDRE